MYISHNFFSLYRYAGQRRRFLVGGTSPLLPMFGVSVSSCGKSWHSEICLTSNSPTRMSLMWSGTDPIYRCRGWVARHQDMCFLDVCEVSNFQLCRVCIIHIHRKWLYLLKSLFCIGGFPSLLARLGIALALKMHWKENIFLAAQY